MAPALKADLDPLSYSEHEASILEGTSFDSELQNLLARAPAHFHIGMLSSKQDRCLEEQFDCLVESLLHMYVFVKSDMNLICRQAKGP